MVRIASSDVSDSDINVGSWTRRRRRAKLLVLGAAITVVALFLLDSLTGLAFHTSADASVIVTEARAATVSEALVVFPGYAADGLVVSEAFEPYLREDQAMIVLRYAQRGVDDGEIYRLVIDRLRVLAPRRVRILGGSLGGMVAVRFLARYADSPERSRFGDVVLVLDTVPSDPANVRRPRAIFSLSSWYRGGPISSGVWALVSRFGSRPGLEAGASQAVVDQGNRSNACIGMPALTTQAAYLGSFSSGEIRGIGDVVQRATYLEAESPQDDPLIRVNASISDWKKGLPELAVVTIATRMGSWHLPWTYRPRETLDAVNAA